jgi:hypothetical protein
MEAGKAKTPEGPARRVSFSELLGGCFPQILHHGLTPAPFRVVEPMCSMDNA